MVAGVGVSDSSRVAKSRVLGCSKRGAEVTVSRPATFIPPHIDALGQKGIHNMGVGQGLGILKDHTGLIGYNSDSFSLKERQVSLGSVGSYAYGSIRSNGIPCYHGI